MYTDESGYSDETDDGGSTIRKMSPKTRQSFRKKMNIVVCLSSAVTLLLLNLVGASIFVFTETRESSNISEESQISKCLSKYEVGSQFTKKMKEGLMKCLCRDSRIDNFGKAIYFSWTLYSTVGYGNLYPHSSIGRLLTVLYSFLMIPIYIAFKFEFGTYLAHVISTASKRTILLAESIYQSIQNRIFDRIPLDPHDHSSHDHQDNVIFYISILICSISLLASSLLFSSVENVSFMNSVYFGIISMSLIGLGDIVPTNLLWFLAYCIFFLICDVLSNQIFYFCQARIRVFFHFMARKVLLSKDDDGKYRREDVVSLKHVPVINTQCMPTLVMDCEKDEIDKEEKLLISLTSL